MSDSNRINANIPTHQGSSAAHLVSAPCETLTATQATPMKSAGLRAKQQGKASSIPPFSALTQKNKDEILRNLGVGSPQNAVSKLTDEARKIVAGFNSIKMTLPETRKADGMKSIRAQAQQVLQEHIEKANLQDIAQALAHLTNSSSRTLLKSNLDQAKESLTDLSESSDVSTYQIKLAAIKSDFI